MMLATTKVEDFDRFLKIFSTKGAEKRRQHGSKGAAVFRDPMELDRVWVIFDWDEQGFKNFLSDPEVPTIIKEAGHVGKPQPAILGGQRVIVEVLVDRGEEAEALALTQSIIDEFTAAGLDERAIDAVVRLHDAINVDGATAETVHTTHAFVKSLAEMNPR